MIRFSQGHVARNLHSGAVLPDKVHLLQFPHGCSHARSLSAVRRSRLPRHHKGRRIAARAVGMFHSQLDSEKYSVIYQTAGARMKETTSELNFVKLLQGVHQALGTVQDSVPKGVVFQLAQGTIRLDYDTTFARGTGREQFVWQVRNDEAILYSYRIDSRDLAGK